MLAANGSRVDAVGFARFRERVVATVKVLALLEVLGEVVAAARKLAVQPEQALLLGREGLRSGRSVWEVCRLEVSD